MKFSLSLFLMSQVICRENDFYTQPSALFFSSCSKVKKLEPHLFISVYFRLFPYIFVRLEVALSFFVGSIPCVCRLPSHLSKKKTFIFMHSLPKYYMHPFCTVKSSVYCFSNHRMCRPSNWVIVGFWWVIFMWHYIYYFVFFFYN